MNAFSGWQGERVGVRMPGKKDSGKYPKSKLILYHNDQFRKVGEQSKYSDMELMLPVHCNPCFKGEQRHWGLFGVFNCVSTNC